MFINDACDNVFRQCSYHIVNKVKTDLESITAKWIITKDDKEFTTYSSYLEHVMHDTVIKPYVNDFAKAKLSKINRAACLQRLVISKEQK